MEYAYDSRGNLLSKTYSDGTVVSYGYTDSIWKDRLTAFNGNTISYDEIGNPLSWHDGSAMTWQRGRQLASFTRGETTATYAYDVDGIRTSKTVNGITTTYTHVDGTLRRMSIGNNTIEFYDNSVLYNGSEYWYVYNAQNDVIGLIDASGNYVVEYTYDSWGQLLSTTGSMADTLGKDNPFRYRGYIYDEETGWYYCQSRYYDPALGRWLNADGYVTTGQGFLGYNMYAYCSNNPIIRLDNSGEFWGLVIAIGVGVGLYVGTILSDVVYKGVSDSNYANNAKADADVKTTTKNKVLNDQNKTTGDTFEYGLYPASHNGCEPIAIHNAKVLSGVESTLSETMKDCQDVSAMMGLGALGSSPHSIGRVLSYSGIDYTEVEFDEMTVPGVYIISYWTEYKDTPFYSIHTVAIKYDGTTYSTYNKNGNGYRYDLHPSTYTTDIICGYYLG